MTLMALCNESQFTEYENAEYRARKALMNIQSIYKDIMGFNRNEENVFDVDPSSIVILGENNDTYNENVLNNLSFSGFSENKRGLRKDITNDSQVLCSNCHNIKETFEKPYKKQNSGFGDRSSWSIFQGSRFSKMEIVQHPHYIPQKFINNDGSKSERTVQHNCPLKVTVPEPFKMTLREMQQRETKELSKYQLKEKLNRNLNIETKKKIHANPVPGHIHLPLFQKIVNMYEHKKILRKQKNEERLKAIVKPFNLTKNFRKLKRTESAPNIMAIDNSTSFRAKPAPKNILSLEWSKDLKTKEEMRKIRIAQRSQTMLKMSCLPFTEKKPLRKTSSMINLKSDKVENISLAKNSNSDRTSYKSRVQCKDAFEEWNKKVAMVNHLNNHAQNSVASKMEKYKEFLVSQSLPFYDLPVKMTTTSLLRENQIRTEISEKKDLQERKKKAKWEQIKQNKKISQVMRPKFKDVDPTLDMKREIEERLKILRESRQIRKQEYEKELQEMKLRLDKRPLLVERQSHVKKKDSEECPNQLHNGSQMDHPLTNFQDESSSNESTVFSEGEESVE